MIERSSSSVSYRWPATRWWVLGALSIFALLLALRLLTGGSSIYQLLVVLVVLALVYRPEKQLRFIEEGGFVLVQTAYAWNIIRRDKPFYTNFATSRASFFQASPFELSWSEWWAAVRNGGRIDGIRGYAVLVGLRRRGIAIPVDEVAGSLAINFNAISSGVETTSKEWSIGWGLYERRSSETKERLPATFVFVPTAESVEDIFSR